MDDCCDAEEGSDESMRHEKQIWECKIGSVSLDKLPPGSDNPMRNAIREAYMRLTGQEPEFLFSSWNAELDEYEQEALKIQNKS